MRITNNMMINNVLYNIQKSLYKMDKYSNQLSTGKKYVLAEDDPINTVLGMHYRTKITETKQFMRNIDDGKEFLDTADKALEHTVDLLRRVRDVAIYGANDTLAQEDRDALAKEVDQLLNGLIDTANTEFKGDFIFSGAETRVPPFKVYRGMDPGESPNVISSDYRDPDKPDRLNLNMRSITRVQYQGDSADLKRQLQQSIDLMINDTGNKIFGAEHHRILSGSMLVKDQSQPLNSANNFNGAIDSPVMPSNPTSFTIGIKGGKMATISYDADSDSIIDIADKINEKAVGVVAKVKKINIENVDYYKLEISAEDSGQEIVMFDSDKATEKTTTVAMPAGFDPDTDGFTSPPFPATPTGEVIINGKQFILSDYSTVRQFMNSVVNDPDAHVSEFSYDNTTGLFTIKSDEGHFLDIKEKGDINGAGNMGFFSGLGINTSGNLLEKFKLFNKTEGQTTLPSRNTTLDNVPGLDSGKFIINGAIIDVDKDTDTLETLAKKINKADVGVMASVEEDVDPAGNFRLVLRSKKPGKIELEDRDGKILSSLGFIDDYDGSYKDYPAEIDNPEDIGLFSVVMDIRDDLYRGDNLKISNEDIAKLDKIMDNILEYRSKIGARVYAIDISRQRLDDVKVNTTHLLSNVEDVDVAEVIMEMQMQQNVQQSALATGAKIIQPTLMDYLR